MPTAISVPKYRRHKARDLAVVTIRGKDHYLGRFNSPESIEKYHRLIAEFLSSSNATPLPPPGEPISVQRLALAYFEFAETYYVKDGAPTAEVTCIRHALRPLIKLFGTTAAAEFGPKALKLVREEFIRSEQSRSTVNTPALIENIALFCSYPITGHR